MVAVPAYNSDHYLLQVLPDRDCLSFVVHEMLYFVAFSKDTPVASLITLEEMKEAIYYKHFCFSQQMLNFVPTF